MLIRAGLEYIAGGRVLAWGLDFPGCFAYGSADADVMMRFTRKLLEFEEWAALHSDELWFQLVNLDFRIVEAYRFPPEAKALPLDESLAFFEDDLRPLTANEAQNILQVFRWQREELLSGLEYLPPELLSRANPAANGTILDSLRQLARNERRYLSCFEARTPSVQEYLPPFSALEANSEMVEKLLPALAGQSQPREVGGEVWTARKLARRLLWQQRVRIDEIKELAGVLGN